MRILAIDIGTGTQDILLFDTAVAPENCFKMVMPAPTAILARRVQEATRARQGIVLTGVTMGGGPIAWAIEEHLKQRLPVFATPEAGRTLNDDLAKVAASGVHIVDENEVEGLSLRHVRLHLRDLDLDAIRAALAAFDVDDGFDALAVAVLDHGNAPPDVSDRIFRFDHIRSVVQRAGDEQCQLLAFAYTPHDLPPYLTRMQAIVRSSGHIAVPIVLLDTGAAAALGALDDEEVTRHNNIVLVNIGNMHTLATHLVGGQIVGLFEHHTGFLTTAKLDEYLRRLIARDLSNSAIFDDMGHGCYLAPTGEQGTGRPFIAVTGPRRALARGSGLRPYFAVPHGDMMMAGCFGLVRACAARLPRWRADIERALRA